VRAQEFKKKMSRCEPAASPSDAFDLGVDGAHGHE
jgi:hypothetical protein